jgi:hypothetical protein
MDTRIKLKKAALALGLLLIASFWLAAALAQQSPVSDSRLLAPLVEAVESIGMTVDDMDRSVEFYTKVLSFEPVSDVDAHIGFEMKCVIAIRRNLAVMVFTLCAHSKTATYCARYFLWTPRNGRRKFRKPVQIPSMVLQCTSRTPSPSSSRAYSR